MTRIPPSERNAQLAAAYAEAGSEGGFFDEIGDALGDIGGAVNELSKRVPVTLGVPGVVALGARAGASLSQSIIGGDDTATAAAKALHQAVGPPAESGKESVGTIVTAAKSAGTATADATKTAAATVKTGFDVVAEKVADAVPDVADYLGDTFRLVLLVALLIAGAIVLIKVA